MLGGFEGLLLSLLVVKELLLHVDNLGNVARKFFHHCFHAALVCKSLLEVDFVLVCQRDAFRVLGHKKNFSATGENSNDVGV